VPTVQIKIHWLTTVRKALNRRGNTNLNK